MKKLLLILSLVFISFSIFADVYPSDYDSSKFIKDEMFLWADVSINVDAEGQLESISGKSWYLYDVRTAIDGREYGYYLVPASQDSKLYNLSSRVNLSIDKNNTEKWYDPDKLITYGTVPTNGMTGYSNFIIRGDVLANCDVNTDYHLYIWTKPTDVNNISFESCMGTLVKIRVNQLVDFDETGNYVSVREIDSLGITGARLNPESVYYPSGIANTGKTGNLGTVYKGAQFNIYYDLRSSYVDEINGSDSTGTGTYENPYKTIQKAVDSADKSTTIKLKSDINQASQILINGNDHSYDIFIDGKVDNVIHTVKGCGVEVKNSGSFTAKNVVFDGLGQNYGDKYFECTGKSRLTFSEGTVIENAVCNSGVAVLADSSSVSLEEGCTIRNLEANTGIISLQNASTLNMTGGSVTKNMVGNGGSAVYTADATNNLIKISGNSVISRNKQANSFIEANVFLRAGQTIDLTGHLGDNALIGIYSVNIPTDSNDVKIAVGACEKDISKLKSDNITEAGILLCCGSNDMDKNGESLTGYHSHSQNAVFLSVITKHNHNFVYSSNGSEIMCYCKESNYHNDCEFYGTENVVILTLSNYEASQLTLDYQPADANPKDVMWISEDPESVLVDSTGKIYGLKSTSGPVLVKAVTIGGTDLVADCWVTVK